MESSDALPPLRLGCSSSVFAEGLFYLTRTLISREHTQQKPEEPAIWSETGTLPWYRPDVTFFQLVVAIESGGWQIRCRQPAAERHLHNWTSYSARAAAGPRCPIGPSSLPPRGCVAVLPDALLPGCQLKPAHPRRGWPRAREGPHAGRRASAAHHAQARAGDGSPATPTSCVLQGPAGAAVWTAHSHVYAVENRVSGRPCRWTGRRVAIRRMTTHPVLTDAWLVVTVRDSWKENLPGEGAPQTFTNFIPAARIYTVSFFPFI